MTYIGRFAPSPTGPLHFGSLVAALGSWLDARANHGTWLVRIEDLDPPREVPGAIDLILTSLQQHGLEWDNELLFQSDRLTDYDHYIEQLKKSNDLYPCYCTRKDIRAMGGLHTECVEQDSATLASTPFALRLKVNSNNEQFVDKFHGPEVINYEQANEDFIVQRKDGLHAYMLAMVVDDIYQGVTDIIRGSDLSHSSCQQRYLFELLGYKSPVFGHLPMALHADGNKLSKQTHAEPIDNATPIDNIHAALGFLNQPLPEVEAFQNVQEILQHGIENWNAGLFKDIKEKVSS